MHTHVTVSLGDTGYSYKNHIPDLEKGDYVVVLLPSGRYTMGKVIDAEPPPEACAKATKWIVDRVTFDTTKHEMLTELSPPVKKPNRAGLRQFIEDEKKRRAQKL